MKKIIIGFFLLGCAFAGAVDAFDHGTECLAHRSIAGEVSCIKSYTCRPVEISEVALVQCVCALVSREVTQTFISDGKRFDPILAETEARAICRFLLDEALENKNNPQDYEESINCSKPSFCYFNDH